MFVCVCVCVYLCVCVCNTPLLLPSRVGRTWALSSEYKTDLTVYTEWMSFLPYRLMKEINADPEALSVNAFNRHGIAGKKKHIFRCKCFYVANCIVYLYWKKAHLVCYKYHLAYKRNEKSINFIHYFRYFIWSNFANCNT